MSKRLSRWLHRKGFRIATIPGHNIHQTVRSDKPPAPPPLQQCGVYSIPVTMQDGSLSAYIGSTVRRLDQRLQEHLRACRDRNIYSVLALSCMSGCQPQWQGISILGHAKQPSLLRWKEALFIYSKPAINHPSLQLNSTILRATGLKPGSSTAPPTSVSSPGKITHAPIPSRNSRLHHYPH